jgi:hypothetical protein
MTHVTIYIITQKEQEAYQLPVKNGSLTRLVLYMMQSYRALLAQE